MLLRFAILLFPAFLLAEDWKMFRYGPFEVLSTGENEGRETINDLEQLRHAVGQMLGKQELQTTWPIRIVVSKRLNQPRLKLGRDSYVAGVATLGAETIQDIATVLIEDNTGFFPASLHRGLATLVSTIEINATRVTLGKPPAQKDRGWSRAHMLSVDPEYSGKLRVLLANLEKGMETDVAYRNAFEKNPEQIERALDAYIAAGVYGTTPVSGKPLDPKRQLIARDAEPAVASITLADLQLANGAPEAASAYEAVLNSDPNNVAAHEGLGLLGRAQHLEKASSLGSKNARVYFKSGQFAKAAELNKRWVDPLLIQAQNEKEPLRRIPLLTAAGRLDARRTSTWLALAAAQEAAGKFADAAKSWTFAERSAGDPGERERIRQARAAGEQRRLDQEMAEREAARKRAEQEIQDLKNRALAEIRAFEAKANEGRTGDSSIPVITYEEAFKPAEKSEGTLTRVDCAGQQARLHILTSARKQLKLSVPDPQKIVITGGGERSLRCGPQRPAPKVIVEHENGEARAIEFR